MIVATIARTDGTKIIVAGVTEFDVTQLSAGKHMTITCQEAAGGLPPGVDIMFVYERETEAIVEQLSWFAKQADSQITRHQIPNQPGVN